MILSTSDITNSALQELSCRKCEVWRQNQVKVPGRSFTGKKGLPDIIGYHRHTGLSVYCEIKRIGDTLSEDQALFLMKAYKAGCIVMIATQVGKEVKLLTISELIQGMYSEISEMHVKKLIGCLEKAIV